VTNRHVIQEGSIGKFFITRCNKDGTPNIGKQLDVTITEFDKGWTCHPNDDIDIAVMPIGQMLHDTDANSNLYFKAIDAKLVPSREQYEELSAIEEVNFLGYPSSIYDRVNLVPVARRGTTASPPMLDYEGSPAFLVFPGSSGSPVFVMGPRIKHTKELGFRVVDSALFIGVISSFFSRNSTGEFVITPIPSDHSGKFSVSEGLDIGYVIKSQCVIEAVEYQLRKSGELKE
jgi:hypothetical protein